MTAASPLDQLVHLELRLPFEAQYELSKLVTPRFGLAYAQAIERLTFAATYLAEADGATLCIENLPDRTISFARLSPSPSSTWANISCYVDQDTVDILAEFGNILGLEYIDDVLLWMLANAKELRMALDLRDGVALVYPDGTIDTIIAKYGR